MLRARLACWWIRNWHWMPWNWIPRMAWSVDHKVFGKGYVVFHRYLVDAEINEDPSERDNYIVKRVWISPHKLEMAGEFEGW
jgi:hypothetical protein